jgi:hypothetical protein
MKSFEALAYTVPLSCITCRQFILEPVQTLCIAFTTVPIQGLAGMAPSALSAAVASSPQATAGSPAASVPMASPALRALHLSLHALACLGLAETAQSALQVTCRSRVVQDSVLCACKLDTYQMYHWMVAGTYLQQIVQLVAAR